MLETVMMILMFLSGGGSDLLSTVDTDTYWKSKSVTVTTEQLLRDAKMDVVVSDLTQQIKDLGANEYSKRNAAKQALLDVGVGALDALKKAVADKDPEIAATARSLIAKIDAQRKARDIRQLMAIRTLGEMKIADSATLLKDLSTSPKPFVADYANRSLAQLAGKEAPAPTIDRKAAMADIWLMPADCGVIVQQTAGLGRGITISKLIDIAAPAPEGDDGAAEKLKMKTRANKSVLALLERVGNVRIDAVSVGVASTIDDDHGFAVLTVRGKWDKKAMAEGLRDMLATEDGDDIEIMPGGGNGGVINQPGAVGGAPDPLMIQPVPPPVPVPPPPIPVQPADNPATAVPTGPVGGPVMTPHHIVVGPVQEIPVPPPAPAQVGPAQPPIIHGIAPMPANGPVPELAPPPPQGMPGMVPGNPGMGAGEIQVPPPPHARPPLDMNGPVVIKGGETSAIVVSDEQMIFISGNDEDLAKVTTKMTDAAKTGKGELADNKEMADAIKHADTTLPFWGVMRIGKSYQEVDFLAPFTTITLSGMLKGKGIELTCTGTSKDEATAQDGAKKVNALVADALKEAADAAIGAPDAEVSDEVVLALLKRMQAKVNGTTTTVTLTLLPAEIINLMRALPQGDLLDVLTDPDADEPETGGPGAEPVMPVRPMPRIQEIPPVPNGMPRG